MKRSLTGWQTAGFVFTAIAGTLLHFLYDWSGQSLTAALFSAVNESIWEHMKLLFFPMFLFALVERRALSGEYKNFWCAKLVGIWTGLALIPVLYYTYTGVLGVSAGWFNVAIFFIAGAVSYALEHWYMQKALPCRRPAGAFVLLCMTGLVFFVLTFRPLHIPLFQDPVTGQYGIIQQQKSTSQLRCFLSVGKTVNLY